MSGVLYEGHIRHFGTKVPPTSFHLALMRLFISVCNLSMILDDLALNAKNPLHCCNGFL